MQALSAYLGAIADAGYTLETHPFDIAMTAEWNNKHRFKVTRNVRPFATNQHVINQLHGAIDSLNEALRENDYSWTGRTDTHIKNAQRKITDVMVQLARG
jgi:hypothetical protein